MRKCGISFIFFLNFGKFWLFSWNYASVLILWTSAFQKSVWNYFQFKIWIEKPWLYYAKWSTMPKIEPGWSSKTPIKRSPVDCDFDHVSHSGLFLKNSKSYWDILWTTYEHYIDGTLVLKWYLADHYLWIYEKIRFAPFFLGHPVHLIYEIFDMITFLHF